MEAELSISDTTDQIWEEEVNINGTAYIKLDRKEIGRLIAEQYKPLLEAFPKLKIQHLDTNLGDYTLFLDFCIDHGDDDCDGDMQKEIEWWLQHRHERPQC